MKRINSQRVASIGILSALSLVILFAVPKFPIFGALPFLEMDFADIPIFIATFMYGPWVGLAITFTVCLIQGITISAFAGIMGILMHFVATGSFVIVAGLIYRKFHTFKGAIASLSAGIVTWNLMMIPFNLAITPLFLGGYDKAFQTVVDMLPLIIAFNIIKSAVNAVATLLVYKYTHKLFNKMLPHHDEKLTKKQENIITNTNEEFENNKNVSDEVKQNDTNQKVNTECDSAKL